MKTIVKNEVRFDHHHDKSGRQTQPKEPFGEISKNKTRTESEDRQKNGLDDHNPSYNFYLDKNSQ
jgi:hypothetical protein